MFMLSLVPEVKEDPGQTLSSAETLERIEAICRRRFFDPNEADECFIFVLDGLKADDYKRLRSFKGRSSLKTFIYTLVNSLATDFSRRKYGRRRLPETIKRLGELAQAVYRLVCWQRYSWSDAYEIVSLEGLFKGGFGGFLKETEPVKEAPCRQNPYFVSTDNDQTWTPEPAGLEPNPLESLLAKMEQEDRVRAAGIIRAVSASLSEEDRLLISLVYGSGHSAALAGKSVGLKPATARKRLKRILTLFKTGLLAQGIRGG